MYRCRDWENSSLTFCDTTTSHQRTSVERPAEIHSDDVLLP